MSGRGKGGRSSAASSSAASSSSEDHLLDKLLDRYSALQREIADLRKADSEDTEKKGALEIAERTASNLKQRMRALSNASDIPQPDVATSKVSDKNRRKMIVTQQRTKLSQRNEDPENVRQMRVEFIQILDGALPQARQLAAGGNIGAYEDVAPLMVRANKLYARILYAEDKAELENITTWVKQVSSAMFSPVTFQRIVELKKRMSINWNNSEAASSSDEFSALLPYSEQEIATAQKIAREKRAEFEAHKQSTQNRAKPKKADEDDDVEDDDVEGDDWGFGGEGAWGEQEEGESGFGVESPPAKGGSMEDDDQFSFGADSSGAEDGGGEEEEEEKKEKGGAKGFFDKDSDEEDVDPKAILERVRKQREADLPKLTKSSSADTKKTAATGAEKEGYQKDEAWVKAAEERVRQEFEKLYEDVKLAFWDPVPEQLGSSQWKKLLGKITALATASNDTGVVAKRYTKFLTNHELKVPLSLVEVAFVASMFAYKVPQLATLEVVLALVAPGTKYDFATLALFVSGAVLFKGGLSSNVIKNLARIGLSDGHNTEATYTEGQIDRAAASNRREGYAIREATIDVFRGLSVTKLPSGAEIQPAGYNYFTGKQRFTTYSKFAIVAGKTDGQDLFAGLTDAGEAEFPYNLPKAGSKTGASKRKATNSASSEKATRVFRTASVSMEEAADLRVYLADVLDYIKEKLGENNPDYEKLLKRLDAYNDQHSRLQTRFNTLQEQFDALKAEEKTYQANMDEANVKLRDCLERLEQALEKPGGDTARLLEDLKKKEHDVEILAKKIEKKDKAYQALLQKFINAKAQIEELTKEGIALHQRVEELSNDNNAGRAELAEKNAAIEKLVKENEKLSNAAFVQSVGLNPEMVDLRKTIQERDAKIATLENGIELSRADWKYKATLAILTASTNALKEALFYHQYDYTQNELAEVAKLGSDHAILSSSKGVAHPIITSANLKAIYNALSVTCRKYIDIGKAIFLQNVKRKFLRDKTREERVQYVRQLLQAFGLTSNDINNVVNFNK